MPTVTLAGVDFKDTDFADYDYNNKIVVGGVEYPRFQGLFVAAKSDLGGYATGASASATAAAVSAANAATALAATVSVPSTQATSTTNLTIGLGAQAFTVQAGKNFVPGMPARICWTVDPTQYMDGIINSYNNVTGIVTFTSKTAIGTGTNAASWTFFMSGAKGDTGAGTLNTIGATVTASVALLSNQMGVYPVNMATVGQSITMPDARTMPLGGPQAVFKYAGGQMFALRDKDGGIIAFGNGGDLGLSLLDNTTQGGVWMVKGKTALNINIPATISTGINASSNYCVVPLLKLSGRLVYYDSANGNIKCVSYAISYSGGVPTATFGTPRQISPGTALYSSAVRLDNTRFLVTYADATNSYLATSVVVTSNSDDTISMGATKVLDGTRTLNASGVPAKYSTLPSGKIMVTWKAFVTGPGNFVTSTVCTIAGSTITQANVYALNDGTSSDVAGLGFDDKRAMILTSGPGSSNAYALHLSLNSAGFLTVISQSNIQNGAPNGWYSALVMNPNKAIISGTFPLPNGGPNWTGLATIRWTDEVSSSQPMIGPPNFFSGVGYNRNVVRAGTEKVVLYGINGANNPIFQVADVSGAIPDISASVAASTTDSTNNSYDQSTTGFFPDSGIGVGLWWDSTAGVLQCSILEIGQ